MPADAAVLPPETRPGLVALRVGDLDRMVAFYRDAVGLEVRDRSGDGATLGAGGDVLRLVEDGDAPARRRSQAGLFHAAFRVPDRPALADALTRFREGGVLQGASDHLVSEALYAADPEANGVEVYRDRPREAWPVEEDGSVGMVTGGLDLEDLRSEARGVDGVPEGTRLGHVHLEVTDLARSGGFYRDALGLRVRQRYGAQALFLAAGDYHHHVGLNTWNRRTEPAGGRGIEWFELVVPSAGDLEAARERLEKAAGVEARDDDGFAVADPDGIRLRLRT